MNADALVKALVEYGADGAGIQDRFMGNAELYKLCFEEFLAGAYVPALAEAMRAKDYAAAFDAAHAIKGVSGNLGLTAYYDAVCELVESLRTGQYERVEGEYAETERLLDALRRIAEGEPVAPEPSSAADVSEPVQKKKREWFIPVAAGVALLTILLLFYLFSNIIAIYQRSVTTESAGHLIEINYQLKKYVEDQVESDWLIAHTVESYIARSGHVESDADILGIMRELRELWSVSDIILYTDDGFSVSVSGKTEANDFASEMVAEAFRRGESMKIVESDITYTVPVETELVYDGAGVAAVSVVKSMESFLDEMGFSSFDRSAYVFLCDENGAVVSRLSTENSVITFNVLSLIGEGALTSTEGVPLAPGELMAERTPATYFFNDDYFVFTPIETRGETFWLAYFVPENIVNKTMNSFSVSVTKSSLVVIALFAAVALFTVIYINSIRKRQLGEALLTRERMFDLLVQNSSTSFGLFDVNEPEPVYLSTNSKAVTGVEKLSLCKGEGGYGLRGAEGMDEESLRKANESLREWDGASIFRSDYILNDAVSPSRYYQFLFMPVNGEQGQYVGVAQDVTLLHERESFIRNSLAMAEQASEAKTSFLSNMSHDIRTPMNAIVNMADFAIEDMADPEKLSGDLKTIRESSEHLLGLINDILDMSRIESGRTTVDVAPFDLRAELRRLQSIISPLCTAKKLTLITDFDDVHVPQVMGDQIKVSQILMNLLSNAVKFTPQNGAVRFTAKETPSLRENYVDIRFTVEDTGMGIAPEFLPHIFEPFTRGDTRRTSGIQGTGLGLSICHSFVVAMGGQIKCDSIEGDGATFTLDLFFEKAEAAPPVPEESTPWEVVPFIGMRCLFCEDNGTNRRIGKTILERLGFRVDLAADGVEGLAMFMRSPSGYYDVVYMDIQMPNMDGYEAAAAIRGCGHAQSGAVPIIAISANVFIEDIEKAHIAGMNGHVGKPVSTAAIAKETKKVLNKRRSIP